MSDTFKVWITHPLSQGVREIEVYDCSDIAPGMVHQTSPPTGGNYAPYFHGEGRQWHRTREGATAKANAMRIRRIASLKKQLAKMEATEFK